MTDHDTTIKEKVRTVLALYPETRHDVRLLLFRVWQDEGLPMPPDSLIDCLTQPETIRRASRHILNDGE